MLPTPRPPDPTNRADASNSADAVMMDDVEIPLPPKPSDQPPSSSLHILLSTALGENALRDASGSVVLDQKFVKLILDLSANNERLIRRLETTVDQLNAKVDPLTEKMAKLDYLLRSDAAPIKNTKKSFASAAATSIHGSIHAPTVRPPPNPTIAALKPKRVIIHSNPTNTTLKDVPSGALVQKANEALVKLDARVEGEIVAI
ncbi:hypothetical protein PGT21_022355 [Puccinia graminis f. sp. tritici]|uniref:Uncharacterized protein n=1 Tax=Puccinia graminis f. sp. tritici TaxID=56615 RepID=A0A5B0NEW6_PUCGR|nr:hypothetical protein PGT21_022355 [Puccinia graminis f. sp. tritici]